MKELVLQKLVALFSFVCLVNILYSQDHPNKGIKTDSLRNMHYLELLPDFQLEKLTFSPYPMLSGNIPESKYAPNYFRRENNSTTFSFRQNKAELHLPGLGSYQHFNNRISFFLDQTKFDFDFGMAQQNTVLYPYSPNYQFVFRTSVEFPVTSWLDAYFYGQYVSSPINRGREFFDPFLSSSPLFLRSEIGGGLKTNFKKVNADFSIYSVYQNQRNKFEKPASLIKIKF